MIHNRVEENHDIALEDTEILAIVLKHSVHRRDSGVTELPIKLGGHATTLFVLQTDCQISRIISREIGLRCSGSYRYQFIL